jgi:hypothetical protein
MHYDSSVARQAPQDLAHAKPLFLICVSEMSSSDDEVPSPQLGA